MSVRELEQKLEAVTAEKAQTEAVLKQIQAWLSQEIAKNSAVTTERDAALAQLRARGAAAPPAAAAAGGGATPSSGSALLLDRARNETKQIKKQIEVLEERLREEKERRLELERERPVQKDATASGGKIGILEVAVDADQLKMPSAAGTTAGGGGGGSDSRGSTLRKECTAENPCQLAIELRAQLHLKQSEFADIQAEITRYSESIAGERKALGEKIAALESRVAMLTEKNELLRSTKRDAEKKLPQSDAQAEAAEHLKRVKAKWKQTVEVERAMFRKERMELVSQIDALKRITAALRMINAARATAAASPDQPATSSGSGVPASAVAPPTVTALAAKSLMQALRQEDEDSQSWSFDEKSAPLPESEPLNAALVSVYHELLSSEEAYVQNLTTVSDVFIKPMEGLGEDVISKNARQSIFSTIEMIKSFHVSLLPKLKKAAKDPSSAGIGQIFQDIYDFTKMYQLYSQNYETALSMITEFLQIPPFAAFMAKAQARHSCGGKSLEALLLIPIQRICSYLTQLTLICHCVSKENPERLILEQALLMYKQLSPTLCEKKKDAEAMFKVIEVQRRLVNSSPVLMQPRRRYLYEGSVIVVDEKKKPHDRHLFLFNDLVLETRPRRASRASLATSQAKRTFKLLVSVLLSGTKVRDVPDGETSLFNVLHFSNSSHTYLISCPSEDSKAEWLANLNAAIEKLAMEERAMRLGGPKVPPIPIPVPVATSTGTSSGSSSRRRAGTLSSVTGTEGAGGEGGSNGKDSVHSTGKPDKHHHKTKRHQRRASEATSPPKS